MIFLIEQSMFILACCTGILLGQANIISSRTFIRPAMFDLGSGWRVGEGGGERARRCLPEETVENQNTR